MNSLAHSKVLSGRILLAGAAVALLSLLSLQAQAQNLTINFRFDGQTAAAATTQQIAPGTAGQAYTIDVWATITGLPLQDPTKVGLVTLRFRGLSSTTNNDAFSTVGGTGVVPLSFTMNSPFNTTANIPNTGDVGSASSYSATSGTLDGIADFGGTQATSAAVANSNAGTTPEFGGGSTTATSEPVTNGWEFMIGQFRYQTGQASATIGATTSFLPVTGLGASASKSSYTIDGNTTTVHGDWTSGSAINFVVAVLGQTADNTNTPGVYGAPLTASVGAGGSYAGIESKVVALQGSGGSNAAILSAPNLGGDAKIVAGTNSGGAKTVSMSWRTRIVGGVSNGLLDETHGGPGTAVPLSTTGLVSDVVNLTGLETGTPLPTSTDPFVLNMSYNPALLPKGGPPNIENGLAANKLIYMVSPAPGPDDGHSAYVNTVLLNTGNVVTNPLSPDFGAVASWSAYATGKFGTTTPTNAQLAGDMGAWGVDPSLHEVWAILDHNSIFAVVPEPASILLAGLGLLGLVGLRRKAKLA